MTYLATLESHLGSTYSDHTRRAYLSHSRSFLAFVGVKSSYTREDVKRFIDALIDNDLNPRTIQATIAGVKALFDANDLPWPLRKADMRLGLPDVEPEAPLLSREEVTALIKGVRNTPGLPRTVVAISTTYGLRSEEIVRVLRSGCDGGRLEVQSAKGGRKRKHDIPAIIAGPLTFRGVTVPDRALHAIFEDAMKRYVREPRHREGWHSLRRSVITMLLDAGFTSEQTHAWIGWREKGEHDIVARYFKPQMTALDTLVYARHAFLGAWGTLKVANVGS